MLKKKISKNNCFYKNMKQLFSTVFNIDTKNVSPNLPAQPDLTGKLNWGGDFKEGSKYEGPPL